MNGLIRYDEFVQRVRRHRTADVLAAVASASVILTERDYGQRPDAPFTSNVQPWSLAAVAKAAIVAGNDFKPACSRSGARWRFSATPSTTLATP